MLGQRKDGEQVSACCADAKEGTMDIEKRRRGVIADILAVPVHPRPYADHA
jgi:hypothetical protein